MNSLTATYYNGYSSLALNITIDFELNNPALSLHTGDDANITYLLVSSLEIDYSGKDRLILSYPNEDKTRQIIEIHEIDAICTFTAFLKKARKLDKYDRILHFKSPLVYFLALGLVLCLALVYFFVLPWFVEMMVPGIPRSVDRSIGKKGFEQMVTMQEVDSKRSKLLLRFVRQINFGDKNLPIQPLVVKSDVVNAYALPDGHVIVNSAILDSIHSPEELVALLGHEFAHVEKRHTMKLLCRNLSGYLVVSLVFSHANGIMSTLIDNARNVEQLSYSRVFEQEADNYGYQVLINNKMDPNGMLQLFQMLNTVSKVDIPKFMSSHPLTKERIATVKNKIGKSEVSRPNPQRVDSIFQLLKLQPSPKNF